MEKNKEGADASPAAACRSNATSSLSSSLSSFSSSSASSFPLFLSSPSKKRITQDASNNNNNNNKNNEEEEDDLEEVKPDVSPCSFSSSLPHFSSFSYLSSLFFRGGSCSSGGQNNVHKDELLIEERNIDYVQKHKGVLQCLRMFIYMSAPYFIEERRARIRLLAVILLSVLSSGISIGFSYFGRDFWTALSKKNAEQFYWQLGKFVMLLLIGSPTLVMVRYNRDILALEWREWLCKCLMNEYYRKKKYYMIECMHNTEKELDNPDQRLTEDVRAFTAVSLRFLLTCFATVIDLMAFAYVLISIDFILFLSCALYAFIGTWLTVSIGKKLVELNFELLQKEADFRYSLVRVRENAESIAFYGGEYIEIKENKRRLKRVVDNQKKIINVEKNLEFFTTLYKHLIQVLPTSVIAPRYFSGKIELGIISQSFGAFNHILSDMSIIINQFEAISAFYAGLDRLVQFAEILQNKKYSCNNEDKRKKKNTADDTQEEEGSDSEEEEEEWEKEDEEEKIKNDNKSPSLLYKIAKISFCFIRMLFFCKRRGRRSNRVAAKHTKLNNLEEEEEEEEISYPNGKEKKKKKKKKYEDNCGEAPAINKIKRKRRRRFFVLVKKNTNSNNNNNNNSCSSSSPAGVLRSALGYDKYKYSKLKKADTNDEVDDYDTCIVMKGGGIRSGGSGGEEGVEEEDVSGSGRKRMNVYTDDNNHTFVEHTESDSNNNANSKRDIQDTFMQDTQNSYHEYNNYIEIIELNENNRNTNKCEEGGGEEGSSVYRVVMNSNTGSITEQQDATGGMKEEKEKDKKNMNDTNNNNNTISSAGYDYNNNINFSTNSNINDDREVRLILENTKLVIPETDRVLIENLSLRLYNGDYLLITGGSGVGKSTLLRAIAGLWKFGGGKIKKPHNSQIFFLPQKPYCTLGSLRDQLLYPNFIFKQNTASKCNDNNNNNNNIYNNSISNSYAEPPSDEELLNILKFVKLERVYADICKSEKCNAFDSVREWSRILSLGEQQRLAFARLLVNKKYIKMIVLDEATSALDIENEKIMYELMLHDERLANGGGNSNKNKNNKIAVVSVGHRKTLEKFHNLKLHIHSDATYTLAPL